MFRSCTNLTTLNISNFDTSQVTTMYQMFYGCTNLASLDVTSFNTSQVTTMYGMFTSCSSLISLNLSTFNTSQVKDMSWMFARCSNLNQIKISSLWDVSNVTSGSSMFFDCTSLPSYNLSYIDVSMAKPTTQGGYLTLV